jgi:hypothetical protein
MSLGPKPSWNALRRAAVTGLAISLSLSLSGCVGALGPSPIPTKSSYGDVTGTGETMGVTDGVYETITVDKDSALNVFNEGKPIPADLEAHGWTQEDGVAGQKLAVDYMVKEFFDSMALEGGPAEFETWRQIVGKKYFSEAASEQAAELDHQGYIWSNAKGKTLIPHLIHDGKPRAKNVDLKLTGFRNSDEIRGILFSFDYTTDYRVNDAEASKFAGAHSGGMSGDDFIKSDNAKPQLKDGTGENIYRGKGTADVVVDKDETGAMKIVWVVSKASFSTDDFTVESL